MPTQVFSDGPIPAILPQGVAQAIARCGCCPGSGSGSGSGGGSCLCPDGVTGNCFCQVTPCKDPCDDDPDPNPSVCPDNVPATLIIPCSPTPVFTFNLGLIQCCAPSTVIPGGQITYWQYRHDAQLNGGLPFARCTGCNGVGIEIDDVPNDYALLVNLTSYPCHPCKYIWVADIIYSDYRGGVFRQILSQGILMDLLNCSPLTLFKQIPVHCANANRIFPCTHGCVNDPIIFDSGVTICTNCDGINMTLAIGG
jgi:hypothetical protein